MNRVTGVLNSPRADEHRVAVFDLTDRVLSDDHSLGWVAFDHRVPILIEDPRHGIHPRSGIALAWQRDRTPAIQVVENIAAAEEKTPRHGTDDDQS